ncbi:MAG: hypothetical protein F6K54_16215 [Okeania sp. SIO3B5]|uniref:hypothetical protein n=1 Tax=Okeania sp. SIO3B5 TaxID=2607811 RepID=UPI0013FE7F3C|nr:hypothetical protein [Okeania sp. SIO3B5]NEO54489.1 hypothetical protein [Okeania sp. SIO3B5]
MPKLKNTLSGDLNAKIDMDKQNHPIFGIDIDIGGVGITLTTENGGTVGIGLGAVGIEYNAEGGGEVSAFGSTMEVAKSGCVLVKKSSVGGFHVHTEVQLIPNCDIQENKPLEILDDKAAEEGLISGFPDDQFGGSQSFPGDPDDLLIGVAVWNATYSAYPAYNSDGSKVRGAGTGYRITRQLSEPVVTGEGYLRFYSVELERSYFRGWAILDSVVLMPNQGVPHFFQDGSYFADNNLTTESNVYFGSGAGVWYFVSHPPMDEPIITKFSIEDLTFKARFSKKPIFIFDTGITRFFSARRRDVNKIPIYMADFYNAGRYGDLQELLRKPENEPAWDDGFTSWRLDLLGMYNLTQGVPESHSKKPPPQYIPKFEKMSKKCCYTEDDRKRDKLILLATGGLNFPGKIGINDSTLSAKFPIGKNETLQEWESSISSLLELQIWRILNNAPADSELTRQIALNLGVPVANFKVNEQYPDGVKKQSSSEDYGFPFKAPKSWLVPEAKGEIAIYNQPQLSLIIAAMISNGSSDKIEKIASLLGVTEEGSAISNQGGEISDNSSGTGFPVIVQSHTDDPVDEEGKFIKDPSLFPKRVIKNLRELELYRLELQHRLYRFSGAGPTLKKKFRIPLPLLIPYASEEEVEEPETITGIIARVIAIITTHGFPPILKFDIKTPGGRIPVQPISSRDYIEAMGNLVAETYTKTVRNQTSLVNLAGEASSIHKLLILYYRLLKLLRKGIGIPWREISTKEESIESGQETSIESNFNFTEFIKKGFGESPKNGKKSKKDEGENTSKPNVESDDIDTIQDEINKPGFIYVKGFDTKKQTLSLWSKLFVKK